MGRPSKGWRLRRRKGRPYSVRFTVNGTESELGLGTFDAAEADRLAAEHYADAVRGARRVTRRTSARGQGITEVAEAWLDSVASTLDPDTRETYALSAETHWSKHWPTVEAVSEATAAEYARARLRQVAASTVRKELSALRGMLAWCVEQGRIHEAPTVPGIPKRTGGTKNKHGRKGPPVELSPAEVQRLLKALPVSGPKRFGNFPIRAYHTVLYETALRPETVALLSVPNHWRPGLKELHIPREHDKARAGRPLPLTPAAVKALTSAAPQKGIIFGEYDARVSWRKAALKVLDPDRAERVTPYDLRRARLTHWAEQSTNLPGIQYLAGHSSIATTARYVKASKRAALEVLKRR